FLGTLCKLGGTHFVERRNHSTLKRDISSLSQVLKEGQSVAIFPEGTTSDGSRILPFKRALFKAAQDANVPVVPVCLNYKKVNSKTINEQTRRSTFYYGKVGFFESVMRLLQLNSIQVEVSF